MTVFIFNLRQQVLHYNTPVKFPTSRKIKIIKISYQTNKFHPATGLPCFTILTYVRAVKTLEFHLSSLNCFMSWLFLLIYSCTFFFEEIPLILHPCIRTNLLRHLQLRIPSDLPISVQAKKFKSRLFILSLLWLQY
jgi:hypothetical protein